MRTPSPRNDAVPVSYSFSILASRAILSHFCVSAAWNLPQLVGRARLRLDSGGEQLRGHLLVGERFAERSIEFLDDRFRRFRWRVGPEPGGELVAFEPGLIDCRQIRRKRRTLEARDSEALQLAGAHRRQCRRDIAEENRNLTAEQICHGLRIALVGHVAACRCPPWSSVARPTCGKTRSRHRKSVCRDWSWRRRSTL